MGQALPVLGWLMLPPLQGRRWKLSPGEQVVKSPGRRARARLSIAYRPVRLSSGRRGCTMNHQRIVSREEWIQARKALVAKEKELTRLRDRLAAERRALLWVRVEKDYVFDAPHGTVTLADLFDGRSQLFVKHFMMGPGQVGQCVGCSLEVDHIDGVLVHLQNHDVSYVAVARAPIEEIEVVRTRMGWRFSWVSSYRS